MHIRFLPLSALFALLLSPACGGQTTGSTTGGGSGSGSSGQGSGGVGSGSSSGTGHGGGGSGSSSGSSGGGGTCIDFKLGPNDTSCSQNSDCDLIRVGEICSGQCNCGDTPANAAAQSRYSSETSGLTFDGCPCAFPGVPTCSEGVCVAGNTTGPVDSGVDSSGDASASPTGMLCTQTGGMVVETYCSANPPFAQYTCANGENGAICDPGPGSSSPTTPECICPGSQSACFDPVKGCTTYGG